MDGTRKVSNFEELQDLILREQFVNSCDAEVTTFLKERKPSSIKEMGKLTDQYVEAHGGWHPGHSKGKNSYKKFQGKSKNFQKSQNQNSSGNSQQQQ